MRVCCTPQIRSKILGCLIVFGVSTLLAAKVSSGAGLTVSESVLQAEQQRIDTISRIVPAVVAIFDPSGQGGGSGVLIDEAGFAITNFHVVQGLGGFMKCGLNDGNVYDAVLVGIDPTGDVAMIQLLGRDDFPHAEIGDSDKVKMGDWTLALGNPFLLADDFQPTVTYGMVSGVHRYQYPAGTFLEYTDCIQVDASINPGNSGGPLFNADGELIGINGRISVEKRGRVNVGAGYAISINQVMNFLDHLKSGRIVDHATLGATVTSLSDGSVVVSNILETSDAYLSGLRRDDELISFAGRPVRSVNQFKNILGIYPKGWQVPLSYQRDGKRTDIVVRLAGLHRRAELVPGGPVEPGPDEPDDQPPIPIPLPHSMEPKAPEIPDEYKDLYEDKPGYANYYFNRVRTDQLLGALEEQFGDSSRQQLNWMWAGTVNEETPVQFRLLTDVIAAKLGAEFAVQNLDEDPQPVPESTGGLLTALHQFKKLLQAPDDYFTEFYYVGSEPLDGTGDRVDVLISTKGLVTSRWYFDRDDLRLVGFDTSIDEEHQPCEIRFGEMTEIDGRPFPEKFHVRHARSEWGTIELQTFEAIAPEAGVGQ
ncbi:Periplasmic serine endoprotease DegP precursor [Thalassoglobus neptunius]|uniref:Periplasmic serine endoprotease DegP n=1 Tax=Thalassoglobus neptunius TaxID=1938619 RepID=A0A5C5X8K0_9PLAN|nr:Periplasmic serine endoprotease DegP precursor [Thalassoglobus neptunius]